MKVNSLKIKFMEEVLIIFNLGKYIWKNSRQYDGEWVKNKMHGFGILKWADGRYYKGQFQNDKRHGKG